MDELVERLTECSICMNRVSDPKYLPCYHTFCCQCIQQLSIDHPSRSVPCPLCRSTFCVPDSGDCRKLPTNVYAEELVRVNKALLEARTKLAAQEPAMMEAERFQKAMTDAKASLSTAKESCQNLCRQLHQTHQESNELANALEKLEKSENEIKNLKDQLARDKQKKKQLQVLTDDFSLYAVPVPVIVFAIILVTAFLPGNIFVYVLVAMMVVLLVLLLVMIIIYTFKVWSFAYSMKKTN